MDNSVAQPLEVDFVAGHLPKAMPLAGLPSGWEGNTASDTKELHDF